VLDSEPFKNYLDTFQFPEKVESRFSKEEFVAKVDRAKEYITAGDAFQIVLANCFTSKLEEADPLKAFSLLASKNPSPFHYCANTNTETGGWSLVGASPELYLKGQKDKQISMRLVAGTYPRSENNDVQQKELLREDPKERAEHFMLVDHARNDIGRSSKVGSVEPVDLLTVESYRDVHHLVSEVRGKPVLSLFESFKNCFPIATLTGTPKVRAMQIIEELEGSRGVFGGSVFRMACDGSLTSSVIIRSMVIEGNRTRVNAGCGVVYDSDSERENEECRWKAEALFGRTK
jgi:anthranilate synthase component 1